MCKSESLVFSGVVVVVVVVVVVGRGGGGGKSPQAKLEASRRRSDRRNNRREAIGQPTGKRSLSLSLSLFLSRSKRQKLATRASNPFLVPPPHNPHIFVDYGHYQWRQLVISDSTLLANARISIIAIILSFQHFVLRQSQSASVYAFAGMFHVPQNNERFCCVWFLWSELIFVQF